MCTRRIQLDGILLNEVARDFDEHDITSKPSVIEPIGPERRNIFSPAGIVHRDNYDVRAFLQGGCCFAIERREAAFMLAERLFVQPDTCPVIRSAKIKKNSRVRLSVIVESLLIPNSALVHLQLRPLEVPVTRHA